MAKRKRLTFDPVAGENSGPVTGSVTAPVTGQMPPQTAAVGEAGLEVKAWLRPAGSVRPGSLGAVPPIAQVAAESSAQAALSALSEAMTSARSEGRLVLRLPLAEVEADYLVRDRLELDEEELAGLITSIRDHGQRSPAEVSELATGRYGLISGWRRLQALTRLYRETGDPRFGHILALVRRPDSAADAYVAMVEENEIRLGLSYYERARIAARAVELGVFDSEKQALQRLFSNASRSRRSKIGSFLTLWRHLDGVLRFPAAIPERLGLGLEKALVAADPAAISALVQSLAETPAADALSEQAKLLDFVAGIGPLRPGPLRPGASPVAGPLSDPALSDPLQGFAQGAVPSAAVPSSEVASPRDRGATRPDTPSDIASGKRQSGDIGAKIGEEAGAPVSETAPAQAVVQEICPGVHLEVSGGWLHPVLTLSGPRVDPEFREALEEWLRNRG